MSLRAADFVSDKTPQRAGMLLLGVAWLYFTEGAPLYVCGLLTVLAGLIAPKATYTSHTH